MSYPKLFIPNGTAPIAVKIVSTVWDSFFNRALFRVRVSAEGHPSYQKGECYYEPELGRSFRRLSITVGSYEPVYPKKEDCTETLPVAVIRTWP